ncbi:MAG: hypothetical protein D6714_13970 [Bacteroidetes bacterium]|nr:MAG: hypothetical protein D6714_13970 [Bacteroidota bacterium]
MTKKHSNPDSVEALLKKLPAREQKRLSGITLTPEWLEAAIADARKAMKRDVWFGVPWFVAYSVAWFTLGAHNLTISIFVIGLVYFTYAIFTSGSYGLNRKRVQVFEQILAILKK